MEKFSHVDMRRSYGFQVLNFLGIAVFALVGLTNKGGLVAPIVPFAAYR